MKLRNGDLGNKALSNRSLARNISSLRSFYQYLNKVFHYEVNPFLTVKTPKLPKKLPEMLFVDEINALLDSIDISEPIGLRNRCIIELMYGCGLRVSEVVSLRCADIDYENMIIELNDNDQILIPRDEWGDISLAYACTCHKLQGSQAKYVIVVLDNSAYPLLMREWLYTAVTRAREYCVLVGQPSAINQATRVSNIKVKQTWIKDSLYELYKKEH